MLGLLQLSVPEFVDFPWVPLAVGKSELGVVCGTGKEGLGGELWMESKIK